MDLDEYWFLYLSRTICFDFISIVDEVQSNTGCHGTPLMGVARAAKALDNLYKMGYIGVGQYLDDGWKEVNSLVDLNEIISWQATIQYVTIMLLITT
jgi:hypothetical protein